MESSKTVFLVFLLLCFANLVNVSKSFTETSHFRLLLTQNGSFGIRGLNNNTDLYFTVKLTSADNLNCSAHFSYYIEKGELSFTANTNGILEVNTNMTTLKYKIGEQGWLPIDNSKTFSFTTGNKVYIHYGIPSAFYNAMFGLVGIALFCVSPILAYKLSDDGKEKIKFLFILIPLLVISIGLALSFIYSGI